MINSEVLIDGEVLEQIAQGVFQTMLDIELVRAESDCSENAGVNEHLISTIQITGAWNGSVSLGFSADLARNAASRMLKISERDLVEVDEQEVAAELTNMIGGNLKSLLPSQSRLSLPIVGSPSEVAPHLIQCVSLTGPEGALRIAVCESVSLQNR